MAGTSAERGQRGVNRVLTKLSNSLASGNYYEAHQMYRTLYFRYTAQQKFDECLELLQKGVIELLEKNQESSAADLALLLIDTLEKRGVNKDIDEWMIQIGLFISRLSPTTVERETIINQSIKWSGNIIGNRYGHPDMHKKIGHILWAEGNFVQARHHYILCEDGLLCANILIKIQKRLGYVNEIDLFVAQAVLQQLSLNDPLTAESTFINYTLRHPKICRNGPFKHPLLNFIHFLFNCIETKRLDHFHELCNVYKPTLCRDPCFEKYLRKIGVLYLGAQPPASNSGGLLGGMFGDIFSQLFQGFDDDEDEIQEENGSVGVSSHSTELD